MRSEGAQSTHPKSCNSDSSVRGCWSSGVYRCWGVLVTTLLSNTATVLLQQHIFEQLYDSPACWTPVTFQSPHT